MGKHIIGIVIALFVIVSSYVIADTLAHNSGGWFGPFIFLIINCLGLYYAYKFIIWYSKKMGPTHPAEEDEEVARLAHEANKKRNRSNPHSDL